ncbi:MAG: DUF2953 domain-containing protein [Ruminococcaceae bacterium]|nr:DUF2953 domain-containing protein [Oscillospiraceae bacterium]
MNGWLIALSAIGGVLLLLVFILCFGFVGARISYEGELNVRISIFGFRKTIFPRKTVEKSLTDVAKSDPKKLLKKEEKRRKRAEKKAARLQKKQAKKKQPSKKAGPEPTPNPKENLDMILAVLKRAYALTKGKLRVDFRKLRLSIATGDAASTAILYGTVVQTFSYLLQWTQDHFNEIRRKDGDLTITPDFLSQKSTFALDIRLQTRGFRAIGIAFGLFRAYRTEKRRARLHAKKRIAKQAEKKAT